MGLATGVTSAHCLLQSCLLVLCTATCMPACSKTATRHAQARPHAGVPTCGDDQLAGISPEPAEIAAHRSFDVPVLTASGPQDPDRTWGFGLALLVDASGVVVCHAVEEYHGPPQPMDGARLALQQAMSGWRFKPFLRDGVPVAAVVRERIYEQRLPRERRAAPKVPLEQVSVSFTRTGCNGPCPAYSVEVRGDGTVIYDGHNFVDVEGVHRYTIPVDQAASLVADMERKDLWSMDGSYSGSITDFPTYILALRMGDQSHQISDYVGSMVGMPEVIRAFHEHVDRVARAEEWTRLSMASVKRLRQEGFDFRSQQAADLLVRAIVNDKGEDEQAMLRLIEYGTPLHGGNAYEDSATEGSTLLDKVLENHRLALIAPMIARGALQTGSALDRGKLDAAFQAAIRGGRLAAVQAIWNQGGNGARPSLFFADYADDADSTGKKNVPVTLLLSRRYGDEGWEGRQIARWLLMQGCDLRAHAGDGRTLLHIAVGSGDIEFVRYLLGQGVDVNATGKFDLPALGSASNEDIALALLEAGAHWAKDDNGASFRQYARGWRWGRVLAWLESHRTDALAREG